MIAIDSDVAGRYKEEFTGPGHAKLVVWRDNKPERAIVGFDYTMARYSAAIATAGADMFKNKGEVGFRAAEGGMGVGNTLSCWPPRIDEARCAYSRAREGANGKRAIASSATF